MKLRTTTLILFVAVVMFLVVGSALAMEISGVVTAVDVEKSTITIENEKMNVSFDCETGTLLQGIRVGDIVTLKYTDEGGKKLATSITRMAPLAPVK